MSANVSTVSFARGTAPVGDTAVFEIFIKAAPEQIWEAITDPAMRAKGLPMINTLRFRAG